MIDPIGLELVGREGGKIRPELDIESKKYKFEQGIKDIRAGKTFLTSTFSRLGSIYVPKKRGQMSLHMASISAEDFGFDRNSIFEDFRKGGFMK